MLKLVVSIFFTLGAGFLGSLTTMSKIETWYSTLEKPWFNPPNWLFGPVWTVLYILMGVSLYLVWQAKDSKDRAVGLKLFIVQLLLNITWSYLFFGYENPGLAFLEIIILLFSIIVTFYYFVKVNKLAGYLLIPYILWVSFATLLNLQIYLLNK